MTSARPGLGLPRAARLRDRRLFLALREEGERVVQGCLIANWRRLPLGSRARVGVVASRRVGPAVVRNRAKRLLREVFRVHRPDLVVPVEAVLVARPSIVGKRFEEVDRDFVGVMRRARLLASP
jgi:ribonuclease P protein component